MINKFKYIFVFLIFIVISFLIINFPKTYFYFHDKNVLNHVSIKQLNLENIYDNYNLTNDEKLEILFSANLTHFLMVEEATREKYEQNIDVIKEEINKISPNLANVFEEYFIFNYDFLTVFNIEKYYLSSNDYRGLTLKYIYYSNDVFGIDLVMDAYDNTIFSLSVNNIGIKEYPLNIADYLENTADNFRKYLNINRDINYTINSSFNDFCLLGCEVISFSVEQDESHAEKIVNESDKYQL